MTDQPNPPDSAPGEIDEFVTRAMAERPDLNQARLLLERDELEPARLAALRERMPFARHEIERRFAGIVRHEKRPVATLRRKRRRTDFSTRVAKPSRRVSSSDFSRSGRSTDERT